MNWSLTETDNVSVFTLRGYLSGSDHQRLQGATAWVAARTGPLVVDVQQLQGCNPRRQDELGACIEYFAPQVVLCVSDPDPLQLSDPRLLAVPWAHLLPEARAAVALLRPRQEHCRVSAPVVVVECAQEQAARPGSARRAPLTRSRAAIGQALPLPAHVRTRII